MKAERLAALTPKKEVPFDGAMSQQFNLGSSPSNLKILMSAQPSSKTLRADPSKSTFGQRHLSVPTAFARTEPESVTLPDIKKEKYPRAVVTGTGVDELFTKRESNLFKIIEEMKTLKTENV